MYIAREVLEGVASKQTAQRITATKTKYIHEHIIRWGIVRGRTR